jgi:ribulose-phosphate 3-epimerase
MEIYPSLISSNLLHLERTIKFLEPHCNGFHLDVMDDHFVPNLTWGPDFINQIREVTTLPLHIHLMVSNPSRWVKRLNLQSIDTFIFHYEAMLDQNSILALTQELAQSNIQAGIAINPNTPVTAIAPFLHTIDLALIMSVNPGFSGQKFIPAVVPKVDQLITEQTQQNEHCSIVMDGGINHQNIGSLAQKGVNAVGVASAIFFSPDPVASIHELYRITSS